MADSASHLSQLALVSEVCVYDVASAHTPFQNSSFTAYRGRHAICSPPVRVIVGQSCMAYYETSLNAVSLFLLLAEVDSVLPCHNLVTPITCRLALASQAKHNPLCYLQHPCIAISCCYCQALLQTVARQVAKDALQVVP